MISVGNAVTAFLAYFRFAQITAIFGANWETDALAVATVFPQLLKEVVGHSFGSTFIPIYSRVIESRGYEEGVRFINRVLAWLFIIGLLFMVVLWSFSGTLVRIISPSGSADLIELATLLLRIVLPIVILGPFRGILANYLKYEKRFRILPLAGIINLSVSLAVILVVRDGISVRILPVSMLIGGFAELVYLFINSRQSGFRMSPAMDRDPFVGQLARMSMPVVFGTMVGFFAPVADKMLASFLPESSVTAIDYANRIKTIVRSVVFGPFLIFADLDFSAAAAKGKVESLLTALRRSMNTTSLVMLPTAGLLCVLAVPVVSVFFQKGNFTGENAKYVGYALAFYAPWLAQFGIGSLVSRAFYAQKDSATPVTIGILGVVTNVLLNLILIGPLGIGGLALATTVASTSKTIYLVWSLSRKMGGLGLKLIVKEQMKILISNLTAILLCLVLINIWPFSTEASFSERLLKLVVYGTTGLTASFGILYLMRSTTLAVISNAVTSRIKKRSLS